MLVAKELANRLAEVKHLDWKWNPQLSLVSERMSIGSELGFLPLQSHLSEAIKEPKLDTRYNSDHPPQGEIFEKSPPDPFEMIFHNETDRPSLPRAVLFGSFFSGSVSHGWFLFLL
jgi:hypothetical protein